MKELPLIIAIMFCIISDPVLAMDKTSSSDEPVILINAFTVPEGKEVEAIAFWEKAADFMRMQPGYISTALHQAILPNAKYGLVNIAKWKSIHDYKTQLMHLKQRAALS